MITYLAWHSCFSRDTIGSLKIGLFLQFCVQKFSADTIVHELSRQRGKYWQTIVCHVQKGIRKQRFYKNILWTTDFAHLNNYITECCLLLFDPQTWTQNHVFEIWFCCDLKHLHKARPTKRETTLTPDLLSFLNVSVKFYLNHL